MGMEDEGSTRRELLELYRLGIEEYHFQVNLNWQRTQYFLAFNVGILGLGIGLLAVKSPGAHLLTGGLFVVGALASVLMAGALRTQHGYYRSARDRFKKLEESLALAPEHQVQTTPGMKGGSGRVASVQQVAYLILGLICLIDVAGALWALTHP